MPLPVFLLPAVFHFVAAQARPSAPSQPIAQAVPGLAQADFESLREALQDEINASRRFRRFAAQTAAVGVGSRGGTTSVPGLNLKISEKSKIGGYSFPVELDVTPFRTSTRQWLKSSELDVEYGLVSLKQVPESVADGVTANRLHGTSPKEIDFTYSVPLAGADDTATDADLFAALAPSTMARSLLAPSAAAPRLLPLTQRALMHSDEVRRVVDQKSGATSLSAGLELDYSRLWDAGDQDEWDFKGSVGRGFGKTAVTGTGLWSLFPGRDTLAAFHAIGGEGGVDFTIIKDVVSVGGKVNLTRYGGAGFTGIDDVFDVTRRLDCTISQSVTFQVVNGKALAVSISEVHVGTGSADVALSTKFGFSFSLNRKAKKIGGN
jgi:hypothetical protein